MVNLKESLLTNHKNRRTGSSDISAYMNKNVFSIVSSNPKFRDQQYDILRYEPTTGVLSISDHFKSDYLKKTSLLINYEKFEEAYKKGFIDVFKIIIDYPMEKYIFFSEYANFSKEFYFEALEMDETFSMVIFSNDDSKTTFDGATFNVNCTINFEDGYTGKEDNAGEVYSQNIKYSIEETDNVESIINDIVQKSLIQKIGSGKINLPNNKTHLYVRVMLGEFSDKSLKKSIEESLKTRFRIALKNDLGKWIKGFIETPYFVVH
jgi:hypothetical protein